ncbi:hypothetical protein FNV43_RR08535 [Rhamnella rubrinervis]|uniref:Disease resistance protein RPM1-like n=1 Tax=Rhamnella rubrinervis TaxID=2594499 RepID=A0A8K0MIV3_9ROSA|nr:hypothetical protein FNV43_RR08535 [Rhamnella rubrinervis]
MAESSVNFLIEKLSNLIGNEVINLFRGVGEQVVYLRPEYEQMRAFLRIADALQDSDEELSVWVRQVRDIAHDTEDILDEVSILQGHDHGHGFYASLCKLACCVKNAKACYRIAAELKGINSRLRMINQDHKRLRHKLIKVEGSGSNMWQDHHCDALLLDKEDLVGIDKPKKLLIGWLIKGGSGREVVSLSGMGGMGKTTLAKQVYDDAEVKHHFQVRAWITVSQSSKVRDLLKDMVQQLFKAMRRVPQDVENMNNNQLKRTIKELLRKRRYLIVLDDVWHLDKWHAVKYALLNNSFHSRVVLTTRNTDVAFATSIESEGKTYDLEPLSLAESWDLFCRKTFQGNACPYYLEEICRNILRRCEGLPLAIVAISGVLAAKNKGMIDEWCMVSHSLGAEINGNDKLKDLKKVLSLSFNDLPYYLKSCFLYLSIFPEDHLIEHMRLIRLWVAEGFIEAKEEKTLEEVAEDYIIELLNRSLMQVATTTSDGRVKTFRIHDLLREIIISKSRDQNFATIMKEQNVQWPGRVRRLSVHNTLQNLHPNRDTKVKMIPRYIGKLQNLETLDLKHSLVTELPIEILKLQRLRHLLLYRIEYVSYEHIHSKSGFQIMENIGVLRSLQKLCFIEANENNSGNMMRELGKLTQLRRLGILKLRREDGKALCSSIEKMTGLRALSIASEEEYEIIDLQHLSSPPVLLQRLYLRGRLETLPHWIPSLRSLVRLSLKWSRLKDDPLVYLQEIPNLVHLILCQVYNGETLCFKVGGFKKLKILGLDEFDELRSIQVETGALPCLEELIIHRCPVLEKVPSGIQNLTKLKVLEFFDMPVELINTLLPDEKDNDYWKVAHIPEVYSTYWRGGGWEVYSLDSLGDGENCPLPREVIKSCQLQTRWK